MNNEKKVILNGIEKDKRISTQELLKQIYEKLESGNYNYEINALGQHNIGGPLWSREGKKLIFNVKNPGQRVGSMGMHGTSITVEGSAPADVGWLNAGAEIVVKGDGGDTTAHCAATGNIYIGGRTGTRSGALMKYDPKFPAPQFWVLKNTGSFSFEFMSGGIAVICGSGCEDTESVLGYRSCVGMVGGTVYVRGKVEDISDDVWLMDLDQKDKKFLEKGIPVFLSKIDREDRAKELLDFSQWKKIVAKTYEERITKRYMPIADFRNSVWVKDGIFGDMIEEDFKVADFVEKGDFRLKKPNWTSGAYSSPCEYNCPVFIPTQKRVALLRQSKFEEALKLVMDYSPFPASVCGQVCPNLCMDECNRKYVDIPLKIDDLGMLSRDIPPASPKTERKEKIAVIGSGAAGLASAYHLRRLGYKVEIFEKDTVIGGKLKQVIPQERLDRNILENEINKILDMGIKTHTKYSVDDKTFEKLTTDFNAVVVAVGAHEPILLPVKGNELMIKGLDFLKKINRGERINIGKKVVVIGAGNAGMDVVMGAYKMGAEKVTAIDIQKPAAFEEEIAHAKSLGAEIRWPAFTQEVAEEGVYLKNGEFIEADSVIVSIGDRPNLSFLPDRYKDEKGKLFVNDYFQLEGKENVFVAGDTIKLGLFTNALGDGRKTALNIDNLFNGKPLDRFEKAPMIPQDKVKNEFYHPMNPQAVEDREAESEVDRCLSCGYCRDCSFCMEICPEQAISRIESDNDFGFEYISDPEKCIGCGICAGVCPCGIWEMTDNLEKYIES